MGILQRFLQMGVKLLHNRNDIFLSRSLSLSFSHTHTHTHVHTLFRIHSRTFNSLHSVCFSAFGFSNNFLPLLRSTDGRKGGRRAFSNRWCASTAGLLPLCCWWWCISPLLSLLWTLFKHIPAAAALV